MAEVELARSPLHADHVAAGARMTGFGGWSMPLQFAGTLAEHATVRSSAGIFDVSHMGQLRLRGAAQIAAAQAVLANDLARIADVGQAQYSLLLDGDRRIVDDLIAYRTAPDEVLLVVNAGCVEADRQALGEIGVDETSQWAMFALQGPLALDVLADVGGADLRATPAFRHVAVELGGTVCVAATTGYTGERGCELLVPVEAAVDVWRALCSDARVERCGLGARDTLRLEACYALCGPDIAGSTPAEAGLRWAAPLVELAAPERVLTPVRATAPGIPRAGSAVLDPSGGVVGEVRSGTMSPVLRTGIALASLDVAHSAVGTPLAFDVRGRVVAAEVAPRPFVVGSLGS